MNTLIHSGWRAACLALCLVAAPVLAEEAAPPAVQKGASAPQEVVAKTGSSTADHGKFEELQREFASGPEVTAACLECHTEAAKQIHSTKHWTWEYQNPVTGQKLGKKNVINNFCTAVSSNQGFCSACHIGYGWKDDSFDFAAEDAVDCLVCHDTTGKYKKIPGLAGHPTYKVMEWPPKSGKFIDPPDLQKVAQNVGPTSRRSCGTCHFYGGGGNAVKHGDLDSSLNQPMRYLDVHMDAKGPNLTCSTCHVSDAHEVSGSRYNVTAADTEGARLPGQRKPGSAPTCRGCHGDAPHPTDAKLNDHTDKLACQTCHIPEFARGPLHTKMSWDWSTAGRLDENGQRIKVKNSAGRVIYDSNKGDFTYDRYAIPDYLWFNGNIEYTLFGDPVDADEVLEINRFLGGPDDSGSRIWPVKTFTGKQPIDAGLGTLAVAHTAGKDDAAYWGNYDWEKSLTVGMASVGAEYSGELGFVSTTMRWPITHMVAPKDDALRCKDCHRDHGRLAGLDGIYMPGRDRSVLLDTGGGLLALLALAGVLVHGGGRIVAHRLRRK